MIFKQSMKSIVRTPKKTILFLLLLIVLTIILSIGVGMYESARNMLKDADKTFTSVAQLDYFGDPEGDELGFYKNMNSDLTEFDFNKLEKHPNVKAVDMEKTAWAFISEDTLKRTVTPLYGYVMVKVGGIYLDKLYTGVVSEVFYGKKARKEAFILINDVDESGNPLNFTFHKEHEYLIIGKIAIGRTATYTLTPCLPETANHIPYIIDLTEQSNFFMTEEGKKVISLQEAMEVVDNSLQVTTVSCLEASTPYYFNDILIKEGRIFRPSEYEEVNNKVILISEAVANFYQVKVGEKINLKLYYNHSGIGLSDFFADNEFDYEAPYEVIGVFDNREDNKYIIYMPKADWLEQDFHSTTIARYMIKNGTGEEFVEDNRSILYPNMAFTLYDQGYAEAVKPIVALKNSAVIIILLGFLSGIAILTLFSYLYVIKQRDTLKTMLCLGTGKVRTMSYILYGSTTLVFIASLIGAIVSTVFLNKVTEIIFDKMMDTYVTDLRYSERAIGLQMDFIPKVNVNLWLPIIVISIILFISITLFVSFTYSVIQDDKQVTLRKEVKKDKFIAPRKIRVKKLLFARVKPLSLKFALTSLIRSPGRSFIIPLISLILSSFLIFLGLLTSRQQEELVTVYDRIPVNAYMASFKNETRNIGGIKLQKDVYRLIDPEYSEQKPDWMQMNYTIDNFVTEEEERLKVLSESEHFEEMYLYSSVYYEYMGVSMTKEGEEDKELSRTPNVRIHNNSNGFDWFLNQMKKMPRFAYVDDIRYTPDFFNHSSPEVEFLEGYNYDSMCKIENIGIISQNFAQEHHIENGDIIRVTAWFHKNEEAVCSLIDFKVVGIYDAKWRTDTIYMPWNMSYNHHFCYDYDANMGNYIIYENLYRLVEENIRAVTFTLKNTDNLSAFRDYLEGESYSQVGKMRDNRRVIVIQDKNLVETIQNLTNHIRLIDTIKPIMLILFGIIGFIVSYILIKHRMNELAIMRSMGAKKRQVFFSFFMEQLILFMIGLIPAAIYALIWPSKIIFYGASLAYFIICYLMGIMLALILMNKEKVLDILFMKE